MSQFRIITEERDGILVLHSQGRLDATTSSLFEKEITTALESGRTQIVADFLSVEYLSSAGLRVLLAAMKAINQKKEGGQSGFALANLSREAAEIVKMAGFNRVFPIFDTVDEAVTALKAG